MKEKKLQVFVSSTYTDLKEERQAAVEAILKAGHIPAGMELFTAGDESQWDVIKRWIDESDIYVLILGARYGSINPKTGKSYTQMEFEYAVEIGKPLFSIVLNESFIDSKVKLTGKHVIETENSLKLKEFEKDVKSKLVEFCEDIKDIKLSIVNKLSELSYRKDLIGWIRGNNSVDTGLLAEQIAKLSEANLSLRSQLSQRNMQSNSLYNGLTYDELKSLLQEEKAENISENVKSLFDLFMLVGPNIQREYDLKFRTIHNRSFIRDYIYRLEELGMIKSAPNPEYFSMTTDGHKFYIKATAKKEFKYD